MLSLGWDLGLVSMCTLMLVAVQHGARDFINNEGVFLVDATLWLMILITVGRTFLLRPSPRPLSQDVPRQIVAPLPIPR